MAGMTVEVGDFKTEMTPIYNKETGQRAYVSSKHLDMLNRNIIVNHLIVRDENGKKVGYYGENWTTVGSTVEPTVEPTVETTEAPTDDVDKVYPSKDLDGNIVEYGGEVPRVPVNIRSIGTSYRGGATQRDYGKKSGFEELGDRLGEGIDKAKSTYDGMSEEGKQGTSIMALAAAAYGAGKIDEFFKNRAAREALMKRLGITDASKLKGTFESLMKQMPEAFKGPNFNPSDVSIKPNPLDYSHKGGGPKFSGSGPFGVLPSEPFNPGSNPLEYVHERTGKLITSHKGGFDIKPNNMKVEHIIGGAGHNFDVDNIGPTTKRLLKSLYGMLADTASKSKKFQILKKIYEITRGKF